MIPSQTLITLKKGSSNTTTTTSQGSPPVVVLEHPIEGSVKALRAVADKLEGTVYGLQCSSQVPVESVEAIAAYYIKVRSKGHCNVSFEPSTLSFHSRVLNLSRRPTMITKTLAVERSIATVQCNSSLYIYMN